MLRHLLLPPPLQAQVFTVSEQVGRFKFLGRVYFFFRAVDVGVEVVGQPQVHCLPMVLVALRIVLGIFCAFAEEVFLLRPFRLLRLVLADVRLLLVADGLQVFGFLHEQLYA